MIEMTRYTFLRCKHGHRENSPSELLLSCVKDVLRDAEANGALLLPWFVDNTAAGRVKMMLTELNESPNSVESVDIGALGDSIVNGTIHCNPRDDQALIFCITKFVDFFGEGRSKRLHMWEQSETYPYSLSLSFQNEMRQCVLGEFIRAGTREADSTRWIQHILVKWKDERVVDEYTGYINR
jgi:hypothetical protein